MIRWDDPRRRQSDRLDWRYALGVVRDGIVAFLIVLGLLIASSMAPV